MILVEITALYGPGHPLQYYFSDKGYVTGPTDTNPNKCYVDRLKDAGRIGLNVYSDGRTGGGTRLELGQIVIDNADGKYDFMLDMLFTGGVINIYYGSNDTAPFNTTNFPVVFSGLVSSVTADFGAITFSLRDKMITLDRPLLTTTYAGNNVAPNGIEGGAELSGKIKPYLVGKVLNISPIFVNTSKLTYQYNSGGGNVSAVYDRGATLTAGADYPDLTSFEAATVASGSYITCNSLGIFRLGQAATGTLTCDAYASGGIAGLTVGTILNIIAMKAGVTSGSPDAGQLASDSTALCGIWVSDASTAIQVMDKVAQSIGAWYAFDMTGTLRMGMQAQSPISYAPSAIVQEHHILKNGLQRRAPKDVEGWVWKATFKYAKNYTPQTTDIAGTVSTDRRALIAQDFLSTYAAMPKSLYPLGIEFVNETCIVSVSDAGNEALRWLTVYGGAHAIYDIPVDLQTWVKYNVKLMYPIRVVMNRFGMQNGRMMRLIGYRLELSKNRVTMVLWS